jgi:hypothetical protein
MKRNIARNMILAAAVCAGLFVAPTGAGGQQRQPRANEADRGADRLKALENLLNDYAQENKSLRRQVKELEAQLEQLRQSRRVTVIPGPNALPRGQAPLDWKPFEFNGVTYYIVPCAQDPQTDTPRGARTFRLPYAPPIDQRPTK